VPEGRTVEVRPGESVEDALAELGAGDTLVLHEGTWDVNLDLTDRPITIRSVDPEDPDVVAATVLDGGGRGPVLQLAFGDDAADHSFRVEGLTIRGGHAPSGGGVTVDAADGYEVAISRCIIEGNLADEDGGGVAVDGGTPERSALVRLLDVDFLENVAEAGDGGGLYLANTQDAEVRGGLFLHNVAGGSGGGLAQVDSIATTAAEIVARNNIAANFGGGVSEASPTRDSPAGTPKITIEDAELDDNAATLGGGNLRVEVSDVALAGGVVRGGRAGPLPSPITIDFLVEDPELVAARDRALAQAARTVTLGFFEDGDSVLVVSTSSTLAAGATWFMGTSAAFVPGAPCTAPLSVDGGGVTRPEASPARAGVVLRAIEDAAQSHDAVLDCVRIEGFRYEHADGAALVVGEGWRLVDREGDPLESLLETVTFAGNSPRDAVLAGAAPSDHSGTYAHTITSVTDPCGHRTFTGDPPTPLTISRLGVGSYQMTGASPWVTLAGTIDEASGAASLTGTGTVAGFSDVTCSFAGTIRDGTLDGTLTWGDANELPCSPAMSDESIQFALSGARD
jgi:hypothetical protein